MKDGNYSYNTKGTCARKISFTIKEDCVHDIKFDGGCNGNLKMISKLLEGMKAEDVITKCQGNICGARNTSCADQLSKAIASVQ